jgi:hypothetical protein
LKNGIPPYVGDLALHRNRDLVALITLGGWKSERMVLHYATSNVAQLARPHRTAWGYVTLPLLEPMCIFTLGIEESVIGAGTGEIK